MSREDEEKQKSNGNEKHLHEYPNNADPISPMETTTTTADARGTVPAEAPVPTRNGENSMAPNDRAKDLAYKTNPGEKEKTTTEAPLEMGEPTANRNEDSNSAFTVVIVEADLDGTVNFSIQDSESPSPTHHSLHLDTGDGATATSNGHTDITHLFPTMVCRSEGDTRSNGDDPINITTDAVGYPEEEADGTRTTPTTPVTTTTTPVPKPMNTDDTTLPNPRREPDSLDLLDRVLVHMFDEEDLVRAETSRFLDEREVQEQLEERKAELALCCDAPITLAAPDVTSTPRREPQTEERATNPSCPGTSPPEILRATQTKEKSLIQESRTTGSSSSGDGDYESTGDGQTDAHHNSGLELDAAGLGQLANALQEALPQGQNTNLTASTPKVNSPTDTRGLSLIHI